jgi:signal recognition particle receptor subunit beta
MLTLASAPTSSRKIISQTSLSGRGKRKKLVCRTTKLLSTIDEWDDDHWMDLIDTPGRKRARTTIRSGSEAGDDVIVSDDDGVMVLSD